MIPYYDVPPSANEAALIDLLVKLTLEKQRKNHQAGQVARRDVHSKSLGAVKVQVRVLDNLAPSLQVGLFATPASYDGVIRFSNGAMGPTGYDFIPNVRGMALKLYGVPGAKQLPGEEDSTEMDLLMANDPGFFIPEIEQYVLVTQGKMKELALNHPRTVGLLLGALKVIKNPLTTSYFSQLPYRFGGYACKMSLVPTATTPLLSFPNVFDRDYLRHAVERTVNNGGSKFTLGYQFQRKGESVEDSTHRWSGRFIPLAEVTVLPHAGSIEESLGEGLSFNPWRTLAAHEPLGWAGRVRKAVYDADFKWRRDQNK